MTELLAVVAITFFAVISPGPDFAMVSRNSLLLSRRTGVLTALGIAAGVCIHVSYTLLGVGLLIQQSLWLFNLIKLAGAAYLIFLGIKMLRARPVTHDELVSQPALSSLGALRTGFLTNVLNPKTTIFIVSLFMQVVQPGTGLVTQLGYGAFIALATRVVPVNRSIAGNIHPINPNAMNIYGRKPPANFPIISLFEATLE